MILVPHGQELPSGAPGGGVGAAQEEEWELPSSFPGGGTGASQQRPKRRSGSAVPGPGPDDSRAWSRGGRGHAKKVPNRMRQDRLKMKLKNCQNIVETYSILYFSIFWEGVTMTISSVQT